MKIQKTQTTDLVRNNSGDELFTMFSKETFSWYIYLFEMYYGVIVPCQLYANTFVFEMLQELLERIDVKLIIYCLCLCLKMLMFIGVFFVNIFAGRRFEKDE